MITTLPSLTDLDDIALICMCRKSHPEAFNVLMRRHLKPVYTYVHHSVQDPQLAEDLTQEIFLRVYRSLGRFDTSRPFKPWLFTIATNVCKTALKQTQQHPLLLSQEACDCNLLENQADSTLFEEGITDDALRRIIHQALAQLPPSIRQAIILRHVYDLPYNTIAKVMQANLNTVRTWLKRGREHLKVLLEQHGGLPGND